MVTKAPLPSPAGQAARRRERRDVAYQLRSRLWELSTLTRVRHCGRYTHAGVGAPGLRLSGDGASRRAGLSGLQSCGSTWSCPVCARKIAGERAEDLRQVVKAAAEHNGAAAMITMTLRHNRSHSLRACWDALSYAWSKVTSGKHYVAEQGQFGIVGWARCVEVTYGETSGWHVHLHALVILDSPTSPEMLDELAGRWWTRWERALNRKAFTAVADRGGLDVRPVQMHEGSADEIARYFNKIAAEVVGQSTKEGRCGNRTLFQVLRDGLQTGNADDLERWFDYEQVSRGRKQFTWSRGLRDWAGIGAHRSDEEIAESDTGGETVLFIDPESWPSVRASVTGLLAATEANGLAGAQSWLTDRGARWFFPPDRR
ncbi:hypothetical protein EV383_4012 [Pseudonocardia sediminis]|uniref:Uncharacterized protein n=1 Tax=Pseudonocardia sediminis TaxID=1397368 RepID=A0A4Q7UZ88_PSEST|nr:hypothetical protein EV383_4012 [Pseudonocardia sediminis]